jgi:hypothetical protein
LRSIQYNMSHTSPPTSPLPVQQLLTPDGWLRTLPLAASLQSPASPRLCSCCRIARSLRCVPSSSPQPRTLLAMSRGFSVHLARGQSRAMARPFSHTHLPSTRLHMRPSPRHKRPFWQWGLAPSWPMSFLRQQSMVPSQDVDVDIRAGHWKISSGVQANSFSASFQVARLAELPEGDACRGQISLSSTIIIF